MISKIALKKNEFIKKYGVEPTRAYLGHLQMRELKKDWRLSEHRCDDCHPQVNGLFIYEVIDFDHLEVA